MIKQIRCLRRLPSLSMEEFHAHWLEHHAKLLVGNRPIRRYVQYHRLANDPVYEAMSQAEGATVEPYDGASIIWWDDHAAMAKDLASAPEVAAAAEDEKYFLDVSRSVACLTEERVIVEPNSDLPYVLIECLRRQPSIDRAAFLDQWHHHAAIGRRANAMGLLMGYIQNCALPESESGGPEDWDGIVTAYFESVAKLKALLTSPLASEESYEDERKFIDHTQSSYLVARRHVIKDVIR